jgi:hypothetical protein
MGGAGHAKTATCESLQLFARCAGYHDINMNPMKTALISVLTATLLGIASLASGRPFDAADFTAILFSTGLVAWTVAQYSRVPRPLTRVRPIRLAAALAVRPSAVAASRLAA